MDTEHRLREYWEANIFLPPFDEATDEQKESVRGMWGFKVYELGCAYHELKKVIKEEVKKVLPKN